MIPGCGNLLDIGGLVGYVADMHQLYPDDPRPIVEQVVRALTVAIAEGEFLPGKPVPSRATLAKHFGVGITTVNDAIKELKRLGVVFGRQGAGVYVHTEGSRLAEARLNDPKPDLSDQLDQIMLSLARIEARLDINQEEQS